MRPVVAAARAGILHCLGVLSGTASFAVIAIAPAAAQQDDLNAIYKRFSELRTAGNYAAALVEAQKYEAAVKARFGVNHANYGGALHNLALVYGEQGKYADAEGLYKRALAIRGELRSAMAVLQSSGPIPPPKSHRPILRVIEGGLSRVG